LKGENWLLSKLISAQDGLPRGNDIWI
jgi:hypothetical protein